MVPVHILVTCRKPDLAPASRLVFKTLRTGFPTAPVTAWLNWEGGEQNCEDGIFKAAKAAKAAGAQIREVKQSGFIHHQWIYELLIEEREPFIILDTDLAFWQKVEDWDYGEVPLSGRFTPQFFDKFTGCITRPRLHTCFLYFNPRRIESALDRYHSQFSNTPFQPLPNLVHPCFHPLRAGPVVKNFFYDTCAMLFHAIGGRPFTREQNLCFDHLNFATLSDLVSERWQDPTMRMLHYAAFENHENMRGAWLTDAKFFESNRPA